MRLVHSFNMLYQIPIQCEYFSYSIFHSSSIMDFNVLYFISERQPKCESLNHIHRVTLICLIVCFVTIRVLAHRQGTLVEHFSLQDDWKRRLKDVLKTSKGRAHVNPILRKSSQVWLSLLMRISYPDICNSLFLLPIFCLHKHIDLLSCVSYTFSCFYPVFRCK